MGTAQQLLERVTPRSAFSITLLTLATLMLIAMFFVQDLYVISVDGEIDTNSDLLSGRALLPQSHSNESIRLESGESHRTGPATEPVVANDEDETSEPVLADAVKPAVSASNVMAAATPAWVAPAKGSEHRPRNITLRSTLSSDCVALVSRTSECRRTENAPSPCEGAQFKVGQTLNIAAGIVEIAFGCGATTVVEGPAVLQFESSKSTFLRVGKLTANVPDDVEGFTVLTPTVQLVSLCHLEPKGVAKLSATTDCQWADANKVVKEGDCLTPGQTVKLVGGLTEITFASGVKVILQGPANFEIQSAKTATLHSGRMTADVPDDLEGFRIITSTAEILSLPTEPKKLHDKDVVPVKPVTTKL